MGLEVCRVNCGGVSAHLSGSWIVRTTVGEPVSRLVGVRILEGNAEGVEKAALERVRACDVFERERKRRGVPDGVVGLEWVMHITSKDVEKKTVETVVRTLAEVVGIPGQEEKPFVFQRNLQNGFAMKGSKREQPGYNSSILAEDTSFTPHNANHLELNPKNESKDDPRNSVEVSVLQITPTISREVEKHGDDPQLWNFTFMSTFDAVSEFTTSPPVSNISSIVIGILSLIGILTIHLLELWSEHWIVTIGWILMIVGYVGIVFGVTFAAILIHRSCVCIRYDTDNTKTSGIWKDGMVVSVKNTDSMDTTGSNFVSSSSPHQNLEAVWIKPSTQHERVVASLVTVILVLAFISHYLGLRAIKWWASVGELCICLLASFGRSVSSNRQRRFKVVEGLKIDKRCMSTGVIRTQTARLITDQTKEMCHTLDARAYSPRTYNQPPTTGERVAFQTAKLVFKDQKLCYHLTKLTGMNVTINRSGPKSQHLAVLTSFTGGILLSEGVGFPNAQLYIAFRAQSSDLASPTALLARAIMRQPEWRLTHPELGKGIPLGNVYIFSIQSMMDWWTLSEDRNDMGDLQRNLHWPMFLVNVAFFVELLKTRDEEMLGEAEKAHGEDENERRTSEKVAEFLKSAFSEVF